MKPRPTFWPRQLVLTPEEKRTVAFVLIAFLLGIVAMRYRQAHAVPPGQTAIVEVAKNVGLPAEKRARPAKPTPEIRGRISPRSRPLRTNKKVPLGAK